MVNTDLTVREVASLSGLPLKKIKNFLTKDKLFIEIEDGKARLPNKLVNIYFDYNPKTSLKGKKHDCALVDEQKNHAMDFKLRELEKKIYDYIHSRAKHIEEDQEVLGGTPVIKGTRINVHSIRGRIKGGDTFEELIEEYPYIPPEAFKVAVIYAKSHPLFGRPKGLPN